MTGISRYRQRRNTVKPKKRRGYILSDINKKRLKIIISTAWCNLLFLGTLMLWMWQDRNPTLGADVTLSGLITLVSIPMYSILYGFVGTGVTKRVIIPQAVLYVSLMGFFFPYFVLSSSQDEEIITSFFHALDFSFALTAASALCAGIMKLAIIKQRRDQALPREPRKPQ